MLAAGFPTTIVPWDLVMSHGRFSPDQLRIIEELDTPQSRFFTSPPTIAMMRRGFLIFPGRLTSAHTFRIGTMGDLTEGDISLIIDAVLDSMAEIGVTEFSPKPERIVTT